jgi:hypothetical protein
VDHHGHLVQAQLADHRIQVAGLVGGGVPVAGGLVGATPAQEVEGDDPPWRVQVRHEAVVQVQVVGKAVQQHDRRIRTRVVAGVEVVPTARHAMLPIAACTPHLDFGGPCQSVGCHPSS